MLWIKITTDNVKSDKYYSIIVDSTPNEIYTDQYPLSVRYVEENGNPSDRFLLFFALSQA